MVRRNVAEQQSNSSNISHNNSSNNNNSSRNTGNNNNNNAGSCPSKASSTASLNSITNSASSACNIVMLQTAPLPTSQQHCPPPTAAAAAAAAAARPTSHQQQQQQQQQQQTQQQQQSPSDGGSSNCSLPSSPPLLQQTATPPQGAQIVPPVCALHHPQQQLALLAAMQHQHHMLQTPLPPPSHGMQPAHTAPHHQHQPHQPQPHENGHGGISPNGGSGGSSSASSVSSVSSSNGGGGGGGQGNNAGNSTNGIGPPVPTPLPPGPLYIQYPGEFYPSEYYIAPHPHEGICPQHPHHPHAHQHHHQPMCAISAEYGPTPVQMVSHNRPPPTMTVPVQVPPYVNENGTLTHVVLPPQQYQQLHPGQAHLHPAPFISANGTSHFYTPMPGFPPGPGPAGNGPPHYHMPPPPPPPGAQQQQQQQQQQPTSTGSGGGTASTPQPHLHSPHSPSPPNYRDERSQRQHTKLLRKLEKQRELNSAMSTPTHSPSPRRNDINGHHNNNNIPMAQHMHNNGRRLPQQQQQQQQQQRNGHVPNSVGQHVVAAATSTLPQRAGSSVGGASSVGTSEDGEDNSSLAAEDEEDYEATIVEQISAIEKPEVNDVSSRSAKIIWVSPSITDAMLIDLQELRYEVLLDTGKQCKYKSLYRGEAYECIVQDLQPGQEYLVRLQVHYKQLQGGVSEPTEFKTPACQPDQPLPPKLVSRTKSSINLRWAAPAFNGASIQHYLLEYDEGRGNALQFVELAKTKAKHYVISKLQPTTVYSFRLAAVNEVGQSVYSQVISYSTSGNPPTSPKPPQLQSSTASSLRLVWDRRAQDGDFLLQLQDMDSGHGYMNSYKGSETHYECLQLHRATSYQFRLRAENEAGVSPWSTEVSYSTASERPGRPGKPHAKGKIHGTHFKARWEAPSDTGGADILRYHLEIGAGSNFERIYSGNETEAMCERLQPGTTYQLRACCEGPAGQSPFSEIGNVTTEAVPPAAPPPPHCDSPPTPYAALLRISQPEYNGGAAVLEFEAQLRQLDMPPKSVYRGKQDYFVAQQLLPGGIYEVQARAINRIGAGNWSQWLRFTAAAAPPGIPESLQVVVKSATHLSVSWQPPTVLNGSAVTGYSLQSATQPCEELEAEPPSTLFHGCYQGAQTNVELRNLSPFTRYFLRVMAINAAGTGAASDVVCVSTPAAVPGAPQMQGYEFTAQEVTLNWTQPASHGSEICSYNIEYGERTIATPDACTRYTIVELTPETSYKFRVQAVNAIGAGAFSAYAKLTTQPAPPVPPKLECSGAGHNYIKLKWSDNGRTNGSGAVGGNGTAAPGADFTKYFVEMYVARAKQFQSVYSGTNCMCKVHKLQERSSYTFRIYAHTDRAGDGDYSEEYVFETSATLPANIKAPRVVHESSVCLLDQAGQLAMQLTLEWQHSKNSFHDRVEYQLQYAIVASDVESSESPKTRGNNEISNGAPIALSNQEYRQLYRGPETKFTIDNLAAGTCYQFRVCAVRVTSSGELFPGQPSTALRYKVPSELTPSAAACHHLHGSTAVAAHATQRSSRKLSAGNGSNNGLHLRSVSASAITGSSGVGADPQAIGRLQHELSSLNACGDPLHHHHHHHHHHHQQHQQQHQPYPVEIANQMQVSSPSSSTLVMRGNHMHHQHHLHHSHHMHHAHYTHPSAAAAAAALAATSSSPGNGHSSMPHGGIVRRVISRLTSLYCNRKRLTDQQKAVFFVVSFVFVTFLVAMLVHMLWG